MDHRFLFVLYGSWVFTFATNLAGGRSEAIVKALRPADHDPEAWVEPLQTLGEHPGFVN